MRAIIVSLPLFVTGCWSSTLRSDTPRLPGEAPADIVRACNGDSGFSSCFAEVTAGTFTMGAQATDPAGPFYDPAAAPDEGPVHSVTLPRFWIMAGEVPGWIYDRCQNDGPCKPDADGKTPTKPPNHDLPQTDITWAEAGVLCGWMGGRLPTEAEWERAARAGDDRRFPWGSTPRCPDLTPAQLDAQARHRDALMNRCGGVIARMFDELQPEQLDIIAAATDTWDEAAFDRVCAAVNQLATDQVAGGIYAIAKARMGELQAGTINLTCEAKELVRASEGKEDNPLHLRGLAGNAAEWVQDGYDPAFYASSASTSPSAPLGPTGLRSLRGGSYVALTPTEWRTSARSGMLPDLRASDVGVRCVRESAP